jgi:16S rRNA (adenine1518-N6/adenine1519-N6)-dimethyltransferase
MYQPSQLQAFLQELGVTAKKGMSQNFLIDGNIIRKIQKVAHVQPQDLILEIGPGPGALTEALLTAGAHVIAVEKDRELARVLPRLHKGKGSLEVFCEDILEFPVVKALKERLRPGTKAKVIANLPYHLTTPILAQLVPLHDCVESLTVMVQKEVAHRMAAKSGGRDFSSLTVFLQFYVQVEIAFGVTRNCFFPKPKVDSAVVILALRPPLTVSDQEAFFAFIHRAFEHRRKMLRSSLRELYAPERVTAALSALGLNLQARPEELSVEQLIHLFEKL